MKKMCLIIISISAGIALYAGVQAIKIELKQVNSIIHYNGAPINRYDLGDVDCFVTENAISCLKK